MEYRYTSHQTARGSRPDGVSGSEWLLVKNVPQLRLTYQTRLLTFLASERGARLLVVVPRSTRLSRDMRAFIKRHSRVINVEKDT